MSKTLSYFFGPSLMSGGAILAAVVLDIDGVDLLCIMSLALWCYSVGYGDHCLSERI